MNGRKPAEITASKGYDGIGTTRNGGPDFKGTDYIYKDSNGNEAVVTIIMTGNRDKDFGAANTALGISKKPEGYTWHHVDDYDSVTGTCTMQLVETDAHKASTKHAGSCAQYGAINGVEYK